MLTVVSHEYDEVNNIDKYVVDPGKLNVMMRVIKQEDGTPQVLLGVAGMTHQMASGDAAESMSWTVCANKELAAFELADYEARQ